jgi:hypothetical protein
MEVEEDAELMGWWWLPFTSPRIPLPPLTLACRLPRPLLVEGSSPSLRLGGRRRLGFLWSAGDE